MEASVREAMDEYRKSEAFLSRSTVGRANRLAQNEDGKAIGTRAQGRRNVIQLMNKVYHETGNTPLVADLVTRAKTKKTGNFVSRKVGKIIDMFKIKKTEALQTQAPDVVDDNKLYFNVAGGMNKKGVVFGTGQASSLYYERGLTHPRESYAPSLVSKLTQVNRALDSKIDEVSNVLVDVNSWRKKLEASLSSQGIVFPTQTCNPGLDSIFEDHFDGDGGGRGGGDPIQVDARG